MFFLKNIQKIKLFDEQKNKKYLFKNFKQQKSEKYRYLARIFYFLFFKTGFLLYGPEPGPSPTFSGPARPEPEVQSPARPEPVKTPARYVSL